MKDASGLIAYSSIFFLELGNGYISGCISASPSS